MKPISFLFLLFPLLSLAQDTAEKGIHFEHGSFADLMTKARAENKTIMIDAYTTWCGPCKWMVKNVFPNDTAAAFYNKNFINAKIDMEKGEGPGLAKKYKVSCYPTYLFIDKNGQLLHRVSSAMPVNEFVQLGQDALNPAKQFAAYQQKYDSGTMSPEEMGEYILMKGNTCLDAKEEMSKYFGTQKEADLTSVLNWKIISHSIMSISGDSREFKYLVDHRDEYVKLYKPEAVDKTIQNAYMFALENYVVEKNTAGYNQLRAKIVKKNLPFSDELVHRYDMHLHKSNKDWNAYTTASEIYIDKFKKEDSNIMNTVAWDLYEGTEDKKLLSKAEAWAKRSIELKPSYYNYDTYAAVLFKLGKREPAQAAAEKAIELARKNGDDPAETEQLLEKIKSLK